MLMIVQYLIQLNICGFLLTEINWTATDIRADNFIYTKQWDVIVYPYPSTHYDDVIMGAIASQITSLTIVFSTVYLDTDHKKHQSAASLAFVRGIHRRPVNSPHKWPVTRKMIPFDDVIMSYSMPGKRAPCYTRWQGSRHSSVIFPK